MIASGSRPSRRLEIGRAIALNHHQRWDGQGYPGLVDADGEQVTLRSRRFEDYAGLAPLSGRQIPAAALIVSLADKYDALRSKRPYKPAFSHEETVAILNEDDRTGAEGPDVFGPEVFGLFQRVHERFAAIYDQLSDGAA
jgi:putative two-component system response regulator